MGLGLPLLLVLPVALAAIILVVRFSLGPLHGFRARVELRGDHDLSEVPASDLPAEICPADRNPAVPHEPRCALTR